MRPRDVFDICHEVYAAARELVEGRVPVVQHESASKFVWRPDVRPRMVEYVADFALAGERALAGDPASRRGRQRRDRPKRLRASRLILFRLHYLGGAEAERARRLLGLSEKSWQAWTDEIRLLVGRELLRAGVFPPARYFREAGHMKTLRFPSALARLGRT